MNSRARNIRFGVFLFITISLLILMLALLVGKKLIEKRTTYYINYKDASVSGLDIGSTVKYHGLTVGRVEDIIIDEENINNIIVEVGIRKDMPIKEDVQAKLVSVGITGLKQIELTGGSNQAENIPPEGYIQPGQSYIENITGRAEVIANKTEYLINNLTDLTREQNREQVTSLLTKADTLVSNFNTILATNRESIDNIIVNLDRTTERLAALSDTTMIAMRNINRVAKSDDLGKILQNTEAFTDSLSAIRYSYIQSRTDSIANRIDKVLVDLNRTINNIDLTVLKGRDDLLEAISTIEETSAILREFSRRIKENPGALLRSRGK